MKRFAFIFGLLFFSLFTVSLEHHALAETVAAVSIESVRENPDYFLLGEFLGTVQVSEGESKPFALQVRPVGRDRFEGLGFYGGLPGEADHKVEAIKMIGQRHEQFVVLSGSPWAIFAQQEECTLVDVNGTKVGTLARIRRHSPTLGAAPPSEAIILFDGTNTDQFVRGKMNADGLLLQGAEFKPLFQDFDLHVEFWLPFMPSIGGQQRGNSGIYLLSRYECQILDSFAQELQFDGCGAIYRYKAPTLNLCLPPLQWQTYDIRFTSPRWASDGSKLRDAQLSIWLNGVKVQDNVALPTKTGHGATEEVLLLPIKLQDHDAPVFFRNIWAIDRGMSGFIDFPVQATREEQEAAAKITVNLDTPESKDKDRETIVETNSDSSISEPPPKEVDAAGEPQEPKGETVDP